MDQNEEKVNAGNNDDSVNPCRSHNDAPSGMESKDSPDGAFEHLKDIFYAIRAVNRLIVKEKDRERLVQGVCDALTQNHGYASSRIVLLDEDEEIISIVESGEQSSVSSSAVRVEGETPCRCMQQVIQQNEVVIRQDGKDFPDHIAFPEGTRGKTMSVCLAYEDRVYGLLSVATPASYIIDEEEQKLFAEVAGDISFALHNIELQEERKLTVNRVQRDLKEKGLLLKEIHHRVKNNMQIIVSLIDLQSAHIKDKKSLDILTECLCRVRSMALIHESLYRSKDFAEIDFADYTETLVYDLFNVYSVDPGRINVRMDLQDASLGIDKAISVGLIINELVSNALKYAFPESRDEPGVVTISMAKQGDEMEISVQDNGIGLPADFDVDNLDSCGLEIVRTLAEDQLEGAFHISRTNGSTFTIRFKA